MKQDTVYFVGGKPSVQLEAIMESEGNKLFAWRTGMLFFLNYFTEIPRCSG